MFQKTLLVALLLIAASAQAKLPREMSFWESVRYELYLWDSEFGIRESLTLIRCSSTPIHEKTNESYFAYGYIRVEPLAAARGALRGALSNFV